MRKTIKNIEVIAYKGMWSDMTCKGFQYEIGKSYKTEKVIQHLCGFHACLSPRDVYMYYPPNLNVRYFKVKASGRVCKSGYVDTCIVSTEITILEEITDKFQEIIENTEWWRNDGVLKLLYYQEDFARVQRGDGLWNFINKKGVFLSDVWFKYVHEFYEGFAAIQSQESELWNYITIKGEILLDKWLEYVYDFDNGVGKVQIDGNYNFINKDGKFISKENFYMADEFISDFSRVVGKETLLWNFIDKNGKYLCKEWFDYVYPFSLDSAEVLRTNGKWCKIDKTGKFFENY